MLGALISRGFVFSKSSKFRSFTKMKIADTLGNLDEFESEALNNYHKDALELFKNIRECKDGYISARLNAAVDVLIDALRLYGSDQLFSSYNGGKDAVVIMHLLRAAAAKYSEDCGTIHKYDILGGSSLL